MSRSWLWFGTAVDALLFVLGAFMAESTVEVAFAHSDSLAAYGVAGIFLALPVFCIACPCAAWRAHAKNRSPIAVAALLAALKHTRLGLHMRAVTQNRRMAGSMGIPTGRVDALTFGLGSGIAGLAGVALSQIDNVSPNLGQSYIIDSFLVVVFGGVGNLWGTLIGALSLGVANKLLEPWAGAVLGKILLLVLIIVFIQKRPRGLFALKGRAVEA